MLSPICDIDRSADPRGLCVCRCVCVCESTTLICDIDRSADPRGLCACECVCVCVGVICVLGAQTQQAIDDDVNEESRAHLAHENDGQARDDRPPTPHSVRSVQQRQRHPASPRAVPLSSSSSSFSSSSLQPSHPPRINVRIPSLLSALSFARPPRGSDKINIPSSSSGSSDSSGSGGSELPPLAPCPFNINAWRAALQKHPDRPAVARILVGIGAGVDVAYQGPRGAERKRLQVRNLQSALNHPAAVEADLLAETKAGRKAGPFAVPPPEVADGFVASPLGAVTKKGSSKVRVIHHLSYPHGGDSINAHIMDLQCVLSSFDDACALVVKQGRGCWMSKIDVKAAYRCIPVRRADWELLGMQWQGKFYYDKSLAFGLGSSCAIWEEFACALEWVVKDVTGLLFLVHYIDDAFLCSAPAPTPSNAKHELSAVLGVYAMLNVPTADDKIEGPAQLLPYLGIMIDSNSMTASLSTERLADLQRMSREWMTRTGCSLTELQSLIGTLSFATKVVRPGRIFLRRMIDMMIATKDKQYIRLSDGFRADCSWWAAFAYQWNGTSVLFQKPTEWITSRSDAIRLQTDACESGAGAVCGTSWFAHTWTGLELAASRACTTNTSTTSSSSNNNNNNNNNNNSSRSSSGGQIRSMPYLELLSLTMAAHAWGSAWAGQRVVFECDCEPVVQSLNNFTSHSPIIMTLIRTLFFIAAGCGFEFRAMHIPGATNTLADALSRGDQDRFRLLHPSADLYPVTLSPLPNPGL
jgi:hypothetical protein